jgi:hypothetical protein
MGSTIQEVHILQAYIFGNDGQVRALNPQQPTGYDNWQDAIVPNPPQPSLINQQFIDWENERLAEIDSFESDRQDVIDENESYNLTRSDYVLAYKLKNQLVSVFANGGSPSADVLYSGFVTALNGTSLETSTTNWITALTGLTNFGTGIPIEEKRKIMETAIDYLQSLCIVGLVKGFIS